MQTATHLKQTVTLSEATCHGSLTPFRFFRYKVVITVDPPPVTARTNMMDPFIVTKNKLTQFRAQEAAQNNGIGGGGGCVGRACYDRQVICIGTTTSSADSYKGYRTEAERSKIINAEKAIQRRTPAGTRKTGTRNKPNNVRGDDAGLNSEPPLIPAISNPDSASAQLLTLLPTGVGLSYNKNTRKYEVASALSFESSNDLIAVGTAAASPRPLDPDFGPRGRSPIEREKNVGAETYVRFLASGALCCSAAHLFLTPIDVVKTKLQTAPTIYTNPIQALKKVVADDGLGGFFRGWVPTFAGYFCWGGISYTLTEFTRRVVTNDVVGTLDAARFEIPIILISAATGAFVACFAISPFETVRIRMVSEPSFAPNLVGAGQRIVKEEGLLSLWSAIPLFILKEVPFAMAEFAVFDVSTSKLYELFPVATEDIKLSLGVSLIGGTLGGIVAAIVSNPADATISKMKAGKKKVGDIQGGDDIEDGVDGVDSDEKSANIVETLVSIFQENPANFFRGLTVRMVFFSLIVSLQFTLYNGICIALGVGADDLKLFLDVLGGALNENQSDIV